jgi:CheY-like chemotaxis protein
LEEDIVRDTNGELHALIIDDNAANRLVASALLGAHGIVSDQAGGGEAGLAMMWRRKYDLVLLDLSMPGLDGPQVCRRIRANAAQDGVYVVAYTAQASADQKNHVFNWGFDALLTKPVTLQSLAQAIAPVLDSRDALSDAADA